MVRHLQEVFFAVNNVYAVLYKYHASECEFRKGAGGPGCTDSVQRVYVSRFTVIGIAPLLNSTHAISIGSTTPVGTSTRIGEPMLICSARAPMIRAFSNRVYRIADPWAGRGRRYSLSDGDGRRTPELDAPTSTLLRAVGKAAPLGPRGSRGDAVASRHAPAGCGG